MVNCRQQSSIALNGKHAKNAEVKLQHVKI